MRYLVGSIVDWTALYKEAFAALKPGGWLESLEGSPHIVSDDGTIPEKSAISQWGKFFEEGGRTIGRTFMVVQDGIQKKAMEEAGFVDIQEWDFKVSILPICFFFFFCLFPLFVLSVSFSQPCKRRWTGWSPSVGAAGGGGAGQ